VSARRAAVGLALALCCAAAALPAAAFAHGGVSRSGSELRYYALDPGAVSTATVSAAGGSIEIADPTVSGGMSSGPCVPDEGRVICPADGITGVSVSVGPEADTVESRVALATTLVGGPGDDTLTGGPGPDRLDAGRGRDTLDGAAGDDYLVASSDGEVDVLRCGDGADTVVADPGDLVVDEASCESVRRIEPSVAPPPGTLGPDLLPPAITALRVRPARVLASSKRRSVRISWRLSEDARAGFRLVRCRAGTMRCTAHAGRTRHLQATAGQGSIGIRLPARLRPGRYRVRARATDGAGNRSEVRTAVLRVLR
jgi:RTX calcium-binding nonapeptide repeat (4 copies)